MFLAVIKSFKLGGDGIAKELKVVDERSRLYSSSSFIVVASARLPPSHSLYVDQAGERASNTACIYRCYPGRVCVAISLSVGDVFRYSLV